MTGRTIDVLFSEETIAARVDAMAKEIAAARPEDLMVIAILKGSFMFAADLLRALHREGLAPQVEFMMLSSYGTGTTSSGIVKIIRDIDTDVAGRSVLIIDDILESGRTLAFARRLTEARGAKEVKVAVLLDKPGKCRDLLTLCLEYEKGKWSEVSALAESLGVSEEIIKNKYLASVEFVNGIWAELTNPVYA